VQGTFGPSDSETLYRELAGFGYYWDSKTGEWEARRESKPIDPSGVVKIRLSCHSDEIEAFTAKITQTVKDAGFRVLDCSEPYRNTRKATHESRVYMQVIRV
jgi:hypothetical protein